MDSPFSVVSYQNLYCDFPSTDPISMFDENPSIGFLDLPSSVGGPASFNPLVSDSEDVLFGDDFSNLMDTDELLSDSFIQEMINETKSETVGNASGNNGESVGQRNVVDSRIPQRLGTENQIQFTVPGVSQSPFSCTFCHILREIIHVKGKHVKNLEIHGRVGVITHAILEKYDFDSSCENHEYKPFDFCNQSTDSVKNFLIQYCEDCRGEGYKMLEDPLSQFYQVLCIGYNESVNAASNDFLQSQPLVSFDPQTNQQSTSLQGCESNGIRQFRSDGQTSIHSQHQAQGRERVAVSSKSFLATQRERTGKMKLTDFLKYFDLPIHEAARRMNVCATVVKKKCRQGGLSRWPYRKIKGIKRKIFKKQEILRCGTTEERDCAANDIRMLEHELQNIFAKFNRLA